MTILIDMDDVLCNLREHVISTYNKKYGTNYKLEDFKEYDVADILNVNDATKMIEIYSDANIYNHLTPIGGSKNVLQKFVNAGHQVYIVTDAIPCTYERKIHWVQTYFPFIDESHIISMKHKWLFKCDVMIEDKMETLLNGLHYDRICFDRPWNRDVHDEAYSIYRCSNWNEISAAVNKINNIYEEMMAT